MKAKFLSIFGAVLMMSIASCGHQNSAPEASSSQADRTSSSVTSKTSSDIKTSSMTQAPFSSDSGAVITTSTTSIPISGGNQSKSEPINSTSRPTPATSSSNVPSSSSSSSSSSSAAPAYTLTPLKDVNVEDQVYFVKATLVGTFQGNSNYAILDDGETFAAVYMQSIEPHDEVVIAKIRYSGFTGVKYTALLEIVETLPSETKTYSFANLDYDTTVSQQNNTVFAYEGRINDSRYYYVGGRGEPIRLTFLPGVDTPINKYIKVHGYRFNYNYYVTHFEQFQVVKNLKFDIDQTAVTIPAVNNHISVPFSFDSLYENISMGAESSDPSIVGAYADSSSNTLSISGYSVGSATITLTVGDASIEIEATVSGDKVTRINFQLSNTYYCIGEIISPTVTIEPTTAPQGYVVTSSDENVATLINGKMMGVSTGQTNISIQTEYEEYGGYISSSNKSRPISITVSDSLRFKTFDEIINDKNELMIGVFSAELYKEDGAYRLYEKDGTRFFEIPSNVTTKTTDKSYSIVTFDKENQDFHFLDSLENADLDALLEHSYSFAVKFVGSGKNRTIAELAVLPHTSAAIKAKVDFVDNLQELGLPSQDVKLESTAYIGQTAKLVFNTLEAGVEKVTVDYQDGTEPEDITSSLQFTAHRYNTIHITYFDRHLEKTEQTFDSGSGFKNGRSNARSKDVIHYSLTNGYQVDSIGVYTSGSNIVFEADKDFFNEGYSYSPFVRIYLPSNYRLIGFDVDFPSHMKDYCTFSYGSGTNYTNLGTMHGVSFTNNSYLKKHNNGYYYFLEDSRATDGNVFGFSMWSSTGASYWSTNITYIKLLYYVISE